MASKLFVDTSAFYALEDSSDQHHDEARVLHAWCLAARPRLFTTHDVLDECVTLLGVRLGPATAARFARRLLASRVVHLVRADEALEHAALNLYERLNDRSLSFTNCVSFSVMRVLDILLAFAFDRHFERAGFQRLRRRNL